MSVEVSRDAALGLLRSLAGGQGLSASVREQATRLRKRLEADVRIAIFGPRSVGKSRLCDALLDRVGEDANDETSRVFFTGESHVPDWPHVTGIRTPSHHAIAAKALGPVVLLDLNSQGDAAIHAREHLSLLQQVDIAIWCTQVFSKQEAEFWQHAPDSLKDHSFLVLTKADAFSQEEQLAGRLQELQEIAEDEFHSILPTTTRPLEQEIAAGRDISDKILATSGVKALKDALTGLIASGRCADLDSAALFLKRNDYVSGDLHAAVLQENTARVSDEGIASTRSLLMERAFDLAEMTFDEAADDMTEVLQFCGTIAEELVKAISTNSKEGVLAPEWCAAFESASDKVVLMTMENDTRSAADATTILLQLRRDLDFMIAV